MLKIKVSYTDKVKINALILRYKARNNTPDDTMTTTGEPFTLMRGTVAFNIARFHETLSCNAPTSETLNAIANLKGRTKGRKLHASLYLFIHKPAFSQHWLAVRGVNWPGM